MYAELSTTLHEIFTDRSSILQQSIKNQKNQCQSGLSRLRCASSDFFGLPILPGPAGRPSCASIAARNRFDP
jgi:hypothetical protein